MRQLPEDQPPNTELDYEPTQLMDEDGDGFQVPPSQIDYPAEMQVAKYDREADLVRKLDMRHKHDKAALTLTNKTKNQGKNKGQTNIIHQQTWSMGRFFLKTQ